MCGKRSSPLDRMWPGHFPLELTRLVVNLTIGEAGLPATADVTQRGMESLLSKTASSREGTLCSGMSLGTIFAVATGSGLALATRYHETS